MCPLPQAGIGHLLPPEASDAKDEAFLRALHHVLLEVRPTGSAGLGHTRRPRAHEAGRRRAGLGTCAPPPPQVDVVEGALICPESQRRFPITSGIPNMLLNEDEV